MRRYRKNDQVWEIELLGTAVRIRSGSSGEPLDEDSRRFRNELRAHWELDRLSAEREADGFELIERDDELAALSAGEFASALEEAPDDIENHLVFGDWLQSHGDPRGELIAVQHALMNARERSDERAQLERREIELLFRHRRRLWGELGRQVVSIDSQLYAADLFRADWYLGFIRAATLDVLDLELDLGAMSFYDLMERFFALECVTLLRELRVSDMGTQYGDAGLDIVRAICELAPASLRALTVGELDNMWRHIPRVVLPASVADRSALVQLTLCAGEVDIDALFPPNLESLAIGVGTAGPELVRALVESRWPALESLSLSVFLERSRYEGYSFDAAPLQPIIAGGTAPRLSSLTLKGTRDTDDICRNLASSPIVPQLRELDLSRGTMTTVGVEFLLQADLERLETLNVQNNQLPSADIERLSHRVSTLQAQPQQLWED